DDADPLPENTDLTADIRDLVFELLRRDVSERPRDATTVLDRVEHALAAGSRARSSSSRVTVLVAEEDPHTTALLRSVLETDGYRVLTTANARDAVNLAFEQSPSLILLDAAIRGGFDIVLDDADTEPGSTRTTDGVGFIRIMNEDERLA